MLSEALSHLAVDAEDLYWYALWQRLSPLDKKRYAATSAFAQQLPSLLEKIASYPLTQWILHKRLLNVQYSIEEMEWLILANLLAKAGIAIESIQLNEAGCVIYNHHFQVLLAAITERIEQLQEAMSPQKQPAVFARLPWLNSRYRRARKNKKMLLLLSAYLKHHLSGYQRLNQPWREAYVHSQHSEFESYFNHHQAIIYSYLPHWVKELALAIQNFDMAQLESLREQYQHKVEAIQQAIGLIYEPKAKRRLSREQPGISQQLNYQHLMKACYDEPLIVYREMTELLHRYIPKLAHKSHINNPQQRLELTEKINSLNALFLEIASSSTTQSSSLNNNSIYLPKVATLIRGLTDYLVGAVIISHEVFNYYVRYILSILEPHSAALNKADLKSRLLIASLALLSLREVIVHCARTFITVQEQKQLIIAINGQLDVIKLRLFNQ